MVTGWVLGTGPCGQGCNKTDIGQLTNQRRQAMETNLASTDLFGEYTLSFPDKQNKQNQTSLRGQFEKNYTETIIAVSNSALYEQELLRFSFLLLPIDVEQEFG